jgi:uncharacterized damage-inducible protein DinB
MNASFALVSESDTGRDPRGNFEDGERILNGAADLLRQAELLLAEIQPSAYSTPVPAVFNASIGGHIRHCLDHFTSLLNGFDTGLIDYDHRERDPRVERDPAFALELTRALRADLNRLHPELLDAPIVARCEVSYRRGDAPVAQSSLGRELMYAIAHGIHHFALISVMATLQDVSLPDGFGMAPSTLAHLRSRTATEGVAA